MGLAGMGNSGTVIAALFVPTLASLFGRNAVLGLACIPLTLVFAYMLMAKDAPGTPAPKSFTADLVPWKMTDSWSLMVSHSVTFGGFVGPPPACRSISPIGSG